MDPLNQKEKSVFEALSDYVKEKGYAPSQRELAKKVGYKSPNTIDYYFKKLENKGWLHCPKNRYRSVDLSPASEFFPSPSVRVPVLGEVPAGPPSLAVQEADEFIDCDPSMAKGEVFGLRVKGDSMKDAGILPGDVVLVRMQPTADDGEIVVARFGDETTVKTLYRRNNKILLLPANKRYRPIPVKEYPYTHIGAEIIGIVTTVIRKY